MTSSNDQAVPEVFGDELRQSSAVQKALGFLPNPPKAWLGALQSYREVCWKYQRLFSVHMAPDVSLLRQQLDEISARAARVVPGLASADLFASVEDAKRNLANAEVLLNANSGEAERIARTAQRSANARRLQGLVDAMNRTRIAGKQIEEATLDERQALEEAVATGQAERAREVAAQTAASAQIDAARAVAIAALVDALGDQIARCAEDADKILAPRIVLYRAYPQSIPGTAISHFRHANELASVAQALDSKVVFDVPRTFERISPRGWSALGQLVLRAGFRPKVEPEPVETQQS